MSCCTTCCLHVRLIKYPINKNKRALRELPKVQLPQYLAEREFPLCATLPVSATSVLLAQQQLMEIGPVKNICQKPHVWFSVYNWFTGVIMLYRECMWNIIKSWDSRDKWLNWCPSAFRVIWLLLFTIPSGRTQWWPSHSEPGSE